MAGYMIAQVGTETIRRGPIASRAEGRRRWPFLPADAAWEGEEEPAAEAPQAPSLPPPAPPPPPPAPPAAEAPLTRGQRLWRERMARKGKAPPA